MSTRNPYFMTSDGGVWTVVVAAGGGRRFGGMKQFFELLGEPVIVRSVRAAQAHSEGVVVVVPESSVADVAEMLAASAQIVVVAGGASRAESVRLGLARVPDAAAVILVHDGARPLTPNPVFDRVIAAVRDGAAAVIPVVDLVDTIRHRDGSEADRADFVAVQTPQGFEAGALRAAHATELDATDDATLVGRAGGNVVFVAGHPQNLKITTLSDARMAEAFLAGGS